MKVYAPMKTYAPKKWDLAGLQGISDATLEMHFGLYEGYVKNANLLNEKLAAIRSAGNPSGADPAYAELVRRLAFEYNGMRLHEYYFDNMTKSPDDLKSGSLYDKLGEATAISTSGRPTSSRSAQCAASVGRSPISTP